MVVCLCHRVSDRDIESAVRGGIRSFEVLQDETLVGCACACCDDCAREVFDAACLKAEPTAKAARVACAAA